MNGYSVYFLAAESNVLKAGAFKFFYNFFTAESYAVLSYTASCIEKLLLVQDKGVEHVIPKHITIQFS